MKILHIKIIKNMGHVKIDKVIEELKILENSFWKKFSP